MYVLRSYFSCESCKNIICVHICRSRAYIGRCISIRLPTWHAKTKRQKKNIKNQATNPITRGTIN